MSVRNQSSQFVAPWLATTIVLGAGAVAIIGLVIPPVLFAHPHQAPVLTPLGGTIIALSGYLILAWLTNTPFSAVFLRWPSPAAIRGLLVGLTPPVVVLLSLVVFDEGSFLIADRPLVLAVLSGAAVGLWTATVEEILVRGYVLGFLGRRWEWSWAILATALLFGVLHHGHGVGPLASGLYMAVTTAAGVSMGVLTVRYQSVWPAVGFHAGWNTIFSEHLLAVGTAPDSSRALIRYAPQPESWLWGGQTTAVSESPFVLVLLLTLAIWLWWRWTAGSASRPDSATTTTR